MDFIFITSETFQNQNLALGLDMKEYLMSTGIILSGL